MSNRMTMGKRLIRILAAFSVSALAGLTGCDAGKPAVSSTVSAPHLAKEIVFYEWEGEMPKTVLDDFTQEYGVKVTYNSYCSVEEAVANLLDGKAYDVVVINSNEVPRLLRKGLLAKFNHSHLSNFKNIAANFRDLAYDPGNHYSIPYSYGTIGLVVRSDLVKEPVTRWLDLWNSRYGGRVGIWLDMPREVIAISLKSLGYSANSEKPVELEEALRHLKAFKPNILRLEDFDSMVCTGVMISGQAVMAMAWARDALEGREKNPAINYVLPIEGALLWGEALIIPSTSSKQYTAEVFINFLLRPDISAQIANENRYATANEAALPLIDPALRNDQVVFPSNEILQNAELVLPLSPEGEKMYADLWSRFMAVDPDGEQ